jgi:hypothetical protein
MSEYGQLCAIFQSSNAFSVFRAATLEKYEGDNASVIENFHDLDHIHSLAGFLSGV